MQDAGSVCGFVALQQPSRMPGLGVEVAACQQVRLDRREWLNRWVAGTARVPRVAETDKASLGRLRWLEQPLHALALQLA